MAQDPFSLIGRVLDGNYRIDSLAGEGSFGVVYKAFHLQFEQPVAVKCLKIPDELLPAEREGFLRRFREEGRLQFQLSQGTFGVVRSIALGDATMPSGLWAPYVVLEWLAGRPLSQVLHERYLKGMQGRPLSEVIEWLELPARALAYAHENRVTHRDIKPGNLFVTPPSGAGQPPNLRVLDFGIAKVLQEGGERLGGTGNTTCFCFTPAYGAPEQFDSTLGSSGPWTDVYSFALVAVEMLTDRRVASGSDIEMAASALNFSVRPTPRNRGAVVSDAVEHVFFRALSVDPSVRYPHLGAFWSALQQAAQLNQPLPAGPPSTVEHSISATSVPPTVEHSVSSPTGPVPTSATAAPQQFLPTVDVTVTDASLPYLAPGNPGPPSPSYAQNQGQVQRREGGFPWLWLSLGIVLGMAVIISLFGLVCTCLVMTS